MSRRLLLSALAILGLGALALVLWLRPGERASKAPSPPATAGEEPRSADDSVAARPTPSPRSMTRSRYKLSYRQTATVGDREEASVSVDGVLTMTGRSDGRTEAQLGRATLAMRGAATPSAEEVAPPIQLVTRDGLLTAIAFPSEMPRAARGVLTALVTALQLTDRPGAAWMVEEEDLLGRYVAEYARSSDGRITRRRPRYLARRGPGGLTPERAAALVPDEASEFRLDRDGLLSATVRVRQVFSVGGPSLPTIRMDLQAKLEREGSEQVAVAEAPALEALPISDHLDHAAVRRQRDEALVAGANTRELLDEALRVARLDLKRSDTQKHRSVALRRLAAEARLVPGAAAELADAIRTSRDRDASRLLVGALGSAGAPEATNALAGLLDGSLPQETRGQVLVGLAATRAPTGESVAALTSAIDKPLGDQAALALGSEAKTLHETGPGKTAVDLLLEHYAQATTPAEKRLYLQALANSGSPRALPVMRAVLGGNDLELAGVAAYGLRFIPGDEVDTLLGQAIQAGAPFIVEAIRATAFRDPALWRPALEEAQTRYAEVKQVLDAIHVVLRQWT